MEPLYVWGTAMEPIITEFQFGALLFIGYALLMFLLYVFTVKKEDKKMEGLSFTVTLLVFGVAILFFYNHTVEAVNNRNGFLQVYADHLVLDDEEGNRRVYSYEEIDNIFLNKQMIRIVGRTPGRFESTPRYDSWDRVEVRLKNGETDAQGWEGYRFISDQNAERIDLEAVQQALEGRVEDVRLNDVGEREVSDSPYFR